MGQAAAVGEVVAGRYRLDAELGRGGMSVVYRASQLALDRPVALKMLLPEGSWDHTQHALFEREARWARSLRHPHIIDILDFGRTEAGLPFMVMELLEGRAVKKALKEGPQSDAFVARLARGALKGLMAAHASGVVHKDIKPSNLFLCSFPGEPEFVKVIDFGIAAATSRDTLVPEGQIVGTPLYIAPEQALGEGIGPQTDLYALGLVLAEALAGHCIYPAERSAYEILKLQLEDRPAPIPEALLHGPWGELLERATAKDPAHRTASAEQMLREVEALERGGFAPPGSKVAAYVPAPRLAAPPKVGDVLADRYVLEQALGERLLASVFRARHQGTGQPVAVKILDPYYLGDPARRARFLSEVEVVSRLTSPHTLRLSDRGETAAGLPFLVFPWLEGAPLGAVLRQGPVAEAQVFELALQLLDSLEEAHAQGLIHGNLKPSNLLVVPRRGLPWMSYVTDYALTQRFGSAGADVVADEDGEVLGSPRYMAPEQISLRPVGPATDLFTLGLILAELLAGQTTWPPDADPLQIARRVASAAPLPLPAAALQSPLGPVLQRATHKDPARRYPDAAALRAALLGLEGGPSSRG